MWVFKISDVQKLFCCSHITILQKKRAFKALYLKTKFNQEKFKSTKKLSFPPKKNSFIPLKNNIINYFLSLIFNCKMAINSNRNDH